MRKLSSITILALVLALVSCSKDNGTEKEPAGTEFDAGSVLPAEGTVNFAAGKFYSFTAETSAGFADVEPLAPWSSGTKLTDEQTMERYGSKGVGWKGGKVEVLLDLGSFRQLTQVRVHTLNNASMGFLFPAKVEVLFSSDPKGPFARADSDIVFPGSGAASWGAAPVSGINCRYVRLVFHSADASKAIMADEIEARGVYVEDPKYVPAKGAYHGAFNNSTSFADNTDPAIKITQKSCPIDTYEGVVGKRLAMFLWYQNMTADRLFSEIQGVRDSYARTGGGTPRFLIYGWLPKISSAEQAAGALDDYHKTYFKAMAEDKTRDNGPLWMRPANEMNGGWVPYYKDPANYVKAWRRMYNIAEQYGVTCYNVFVWSPNSYDSPATAQNRMADYYPGDIYVDWIGMSCYPPSKSNNYTEDQRYPANRVKEVLSISATKPVLITEGAFSSDYGQSDANKANASIYASDHVRWVREWFALKDTEPRIKGVVWENHINASGGDRRIHRDAEALKVYRELVDDDYWLGEIPEEVLKEIERRKGN